MCVCVCVCVSGEKKNGIEEMNENVHTAYWIVRSLFADFQNVLLHNGSPVKKNPWKLYITEEWRNIYSLQYPNLSISLSTYTYVRSWALLEKVPVVQLLKNFPSILWNLKVHFT
jgi:hypothetical protein